MLEKRTPQGVTTEDTMKKGLLIAAGLMVAGLCIWSLSWGATERTILIAGVLVGAAALRRTLKPPDEKILK
jgi:hypothetical protein